MDGWQTAIAIIGSVAIAAGTLVKIFARNGGKNNGPKEMAKLDKRVSLTEQAVTNLGEKVDEVKQAQVQERQERREANATIFQKLDKIIERQSG